MDDITAGNTTSAQPTAGSPGRRRAVRFRAFQQYPSRSRSAVLLRKSPISASGDFQQARRFPLRRLSPWLSIPGVPSRSNVPPREVRVSSTRLGRGPRPARSGVGAAKHPAGRGRRPEKRGGQPGQLRWRSALVVTQLTISLVLLVGAGLFLRSYQRVQSVDPGFGCEPTALMTFLTPATRFAPYEARVYTRRLLDLFRALPPASRRSARPKSAQPELDRLQPPRVRAAGGPRRLDRGSLTPGRWYFSRRHPLLARGRAIA